MEKRTENPAVLALATESGEAYDIPEDGSLGLLALGYAGLMLWRERRRTQIVPATSIVESDTRRLTSQM